MQTQAQALGNVLDKAPGGWVFPRDPGSVLGRTLTPLASEHVLFEQAAEALLEEATPSTATALLADYERVLGPDPCMAPAATLDARRLSAHARWVGVQGASIADYTDLAARYGYAITVEEHRPLQFGSPFGVRFAGDAWAYTWTVHVAPQPAAAWDPVAFAWVSPTLECVLRRTAPADTVLRIAFHADLDDFVLDRDWID